MMKSNGPAPALTPMQLQQRTVHRPSVQSVEWSRDPTTGDDLVIRNNADAFSDNSSRINARQGFQQALETLKSPQFSSNYVRNNKTENAFQKSHL